MRRKKLNNSAQLHLRKRKVRNDGTRYAASPDIAARETFLVMSRTYIIMILDALQLESSFKLDMLLRVEEYFLDFRRVPGAVFAGSKQYSPE